MQTGNVIAHIVKSTIIVIGEEIQTVGQGIKYMTELGNAKRLIREEIESKYNEFLSSSRGKELVEELIDARFLGYISWVRENHPRELPLDLRYGNRGDREWDELMD